MSSTPGDLDLGVRRLTDRLAGLTSPKAPERFYPYAIHRTYLCGHPDEFIVVNNVAGFRPPRIQHCVIPPYKANEICEGPLMTYQQTLERCRTCASAFSAEKRKNKLIPLSQNAYEGMVQDESAQWEKDGFSHVLRRYRSGGWTSRYPVKWRDEGNKNIVYQRMRDQHKKIMRERSHLPHKKVPYTERMVPRAVDGPNGLRYIVEERVDEDLAPPLPPPLKRFLQSEVEEAEGRQLAVQGLSRSRTERVRRGREAEDDVLVRDRRSDPQHSRSPGHYAGARGLIKKSEWEVGDQTQRQGLMRSHTLATPRGTARHDQAQRPWGPVRESGGTTVSDTIVPQFDRRISLRRKPPVQGQIHIPPATRIEPKMLRERPQRSPRTSGPLNPDAGIRRGSGGPIMGSRRAQRVVHGDSLSGDNVPLDYGRPRANSYGQMVKDQRSPRGSGELRYSSSERMGVPSLSAELNRDPHEQRDGQISPYGSGVLYRGSEVSQPPLPPSSSYRELPRRASDGLQVHEETLRFLEGLPPTRGSS